MHFMTLKEDARSGLPHGAKRDLDLIDEALANRGKRALAEAALHIAARMVEQAQEISGQEAPLSQPEEDALGRLGVDATAPMSDAEFYRSDPLLEGMTRQALLTADAVPLAEAARRIGVSDARLRQRIAAGTMMAIHRPHGRGWLIPAFQLEAEGEIPHLGRVLLAAGRPVSAQAMDRFFRIPREDLGGASPRDWLIAGHDPSIVERIVAGL
ncbi:MULTISPECIES: hypothetical protein [Rhodobacterales]|uniref:DNA binding domain-containing protein, excisionase family n=1 Tax=Roseivivax sediminis TaxID=936889 RepID=A0A1I2DM40_9RHOB|nr:MULTISPECIES: hypothetical protein [Rhodobacterales]MCA1334880.1 hypothetical protein [Pseudooceanicola marinus]SFE81488.1 hypothetical protein SAMN04515678_11757 [Roseivivax sediminis]